jgi:predicted dehydrogenase
MSRKKINIAIVGLGFGAEFIPIYQHHPNANMYAICQRDPKKLEAVGEAFGVEVRYTDFRELIRDPKRCTLIPRFRIMAG